MAEADLRLDVAFAKLEAAVERLLNNAQQWEGDKEEAKRFDHIVEECDRLRAESGELQEEVVLLKAENEDLKQQLAALHKHYTRLKKLNGDVSDRLDASIQQLKFILEEEENS